MSGLDIVLDAVREMSATGQSTMDALVEQAQAPSEPSSDEDSPEEAQAPVGPSDKDAPVCCICLQGASDRDPFVPADGCECGNAKGEHKPTHHSSCIQRWLATGAGCPVCRKGGPKPPPPSREVQRARESASARADRRAQRGWVGEPDAPVSFSVLRRLARLARLLWVAPGLLRRV